MRSSTTRSPSSADTATGPVLWADWNTTVSPGPRRSIVRPGVPRGERGRAVVADDVAGVGDVLQAQGEAQVRVGPDVVADDAGRALGGQHEVDAEAATALGDADERRQERRQLGGEGGELVDHDDQPGQRRPTGHGPVLGEVGGAGRPQDPLPPADLGLQADERPLGEPVVEVGDHADGVGQVGAGVERRPALVVDEHERQVVRARPGGQRDDERPQQLALAGARSCRR